ncbi:MAG: YheU family protein [Chromatiales bacterium]|nr:YheU family protein [Chromatiales bacterium]
MAAEADDEEGPVEVPWRELPAGTLDELLRSWVLREGTDYGHREHALEDKVASVRRQLAAGKARIIWDLESESFDIVAAHR